MVVYHFDQHPINPPRPGREPSGPMQGRVIGAEYTVVQALEWAFAHLHTSHIKPSEIWCDGELIYDAATIQELYTALHTEGAPDGH